MILPVMFNKSSVQRLGYRILSQTHTGRAHFIPISLQMFIRRYQKFLFYRFPNVATPICHTLSECCCFNRRFVYKQATNKKSMASSCFHAFSMDYLQMAKFCCQCRPSCPQSQDVEVVCAPPFVFLSEAGPIFFDETYG